MLGNRGGALGGITSGLGSVLGNRGGALGGITSGLGSVLGGQGGGLLQDVTQGPLARLLGGEEEQVLP